MTHRRATLGGDFWKFCPICHGEREYKQTYTAGCGGGNFSAMGPCDFCDEQGFVYRESGRAVPLSVTNQIRVAMLAERDK